MLVETLLALLYIARSALIADMLKLASHVLSTSVIGGKQDNLNKQTAAPVA
jgi:hypothetical protein